MDERKVTISSRKELRFLIRHRREVSLEADVSLGFQCGLGDALSVNASSIDLCGAKLSCSQGGGFKCEGNVINSCDLNYSAGIGVAGFGYEFNCKGGNYLDYSTATHSINYSPLSVLDLGIEYGDNTRLSISAGGNVNLILGIEVNASIDL